VRASKKRSACAAHTLAEVYATMTALPVKDVIPPDQALLFVQETRDRCAIVTLTEDEYLDAMERAAARGLTSGRIYDGASVCVAPRKSELRSSTPWNLKHFRTIRPDMTDRIRTP